MKMMKYFALVSLAACASGAFADAADTLISFYTTADKYADSTAVVDKEWYALCWSPDGVFEGIKADCTPYDENDKILMTAQLAKNGHCPFTVFEVDRKVAPKGGKYCVVLLDTREGGVPAASKAGKREPQTIKQAIASANYTVTGTDTGTSVTPVATTGSWGVTIDPSKPGFEPAKIAGIDVGDTDVAIQLENLQPGAKYNVKTGKDLNNIKTYGLSTPVTGSEGGVAEVFISKENAKYFKVDTEPISK